MMKHACFMLEVSFFIFYLSNGMTTTIYTLSMIDNLISFIVYTRRF
jgi:hypothetical protein